MTREDIKARSIRGLMWAASESVGVALISFVSFVVLARLLDPQAFGIVALATVFVYFCNLVTGHSFADALVQRREVEREHLDTAFWSTLGIALLLMAGCMAGADAIASALGEPALAEALRWLSLLLPLAALCSVHMANFRRNMQFDAVARRVLLGRGIGAVAGIAAAVEGYGFWSLVIQQLVGQSVTTAAFYVNPWVPRFRFCPRRFGEMFGFGVKVSANQVVSGAAEQVLNLSIGVFLGTTALGYFTLAWRAVQLIRSLVSSAVYQVGLSAFSRLQHDREAIASAFLNATRISCLVGFPVAVGMVMVNEPLVLAAFDEQWRRSIPLFAILALGLIPSFYAMFVSALYRAMDRAGWGLATALLSSVIGLGGAYAVSPLGLTAVASVWVARTFLLLPLHVVLVRRLLGVPYTHLLTPIVPPLAAATAMAAALAVMRLTVTADLTPLASIGVLVPAGAAVYIATICAVSPDLVHLALRIVGRTSPPAGKTT